MSKTNAKQEFISHIGNRKVKCAKISKGDEVSFELGCAYNTDEWNEFLKKLDFGYNSGYGGQELFGTIWYEDGTWSVINTCARVGSTMSCSEWYEYHICPEIPTELKRIDRVRDNKIEEIIN
jgi:hypothetical protein